MKQTEALAILKTGLNVFLTGEPGSGKTHTINTYVRWLSERGVDASVTASTGIAATHIGGMTIHSWSGIGVKRRITDEDVEYILSKEKTAKRIIDAKVLIIDEVSMLDAQTLESVEYVTRMLRRAPMTQGTPFGGLQIVFVGDFFQLPPVTHRSDNEDGEEREPHFAFESAAWKSANPIICYLDEQHRQEDGEFLDILAHMRQVRLDAKHRARLFERVGKTPHGSAATRLYTHNADVDRINTEHLDAIKSPARVFQMSSHGGHALVDMLKKNCLSPETLTLKAGAAVMFTRNNFEVGYVNGTLGEVIDFAPGGDPVVRLRSGRTLTVEHAEWAVQDGNKILARINQVPLRLAWAITVHKSQGMSLDAAVIDLSQAFEYGQGYVAISRVRTLDGLYLEGINARALEVHPQVVVHDKYFRAYSDAAGKKFAALPASEKEKMEKNFLRAIGGKEPEMAAALRGDSSQDESSAESLARKRDALKQKYPNIGKPWKKEDDAELREMFLQERKNADIARHFGRKPSAIRARLGHLGLIEDTWQGYHEKHEQSD